MSACGTELPIWNLRFHGRSRRLSGRATHIPTISGCSDGHYQRDQSMGWASIYIAKLRAGETVSFRPRGNSMTGKIESGQLCTGAPVNVATLKVGDIVCVRLGVASTYISSRQLRMAGSKLAITAAGSTVGLDQILSSATAHASKNERGRES